LQADVVLGDDVLGRHVQHDRAQAHPRHAVDRPGDQDEPRPLGGGQELSQAEDDPPLVLVEDLHREKDPEDDDEDDDARSHHGSFRTLSVRPLTAATVTVCPAGTGESATARHLSPWTSTQPCGSRGVSATPVSPTMAEAPVRVGRRWAWRTRRTRSIVPTATTAAAGSSVPSETRISAAGASTSSMGPRVLGAIPPPAERP